MKSRKGFTLIELVAVVTFVAIIGIVVAINITNQVKKQEEKNYDRYLEIITSATELYVEQHRNRYVTLDKEGSSIYISISELISANMIDETLTNPKTNNYVSKSGRVKVTVRSDKTLEYIVEE